MKKFSILVLIVLAIFAVGNIALAGDNDKPTNTAGTDKACAKVCKDKDKCAAGKAQCTTADKAKCTKDANGKCTHTGPCTDSCKAACKTADGKTCDPAKCKAAGKTCDPKNCKPGTSCDPKNCKGHSGK